MKPLRISALVAVCALLAAVALWFFTDAPMGNVAPFTDAAPRVDGASTLTPMVDSSQEPERVVEEIIAPVAQAEATPVPLPVEPALAMRQDLRWAAAMPERSFAAFREWSGRFEKATSAQRNALLAEGRKLVEERRQEMSELIDKNPKRALELAVPVAVRRALPEDIAARVEEPVRGRGDIWVAAAIPMPGFEMNVRATQRTVQMKDGRLFDAFTFGRRADSPTRMDIAIHGVVLDGKLALDELPGRVLEPIEAAEAKTGGEICPTSGIATAALGEEVAVDFGDAKPLFFCGPSHAYSVLIEAADAEGKRLPAIAMAGGDGGAGDFPIAESGYTEGTKKLLIIRVDFPDFAGQVVSDATLTSLIANMKTQWDAMSYGKLTWTALGSGSAFTPTLRLPNGHASYTDFATMLGAARAAAADAGFNYQDYQFDVVVTGSRPSVGFGGIAYVGGRGAWLANSQWNLGVCSHEVGHNFGLNHAGFWDTDDGSPIGSGSAVEYGNPFDHMGGASSSFDAHFGARQKNYLDWLVDADVRKIGADGQVLQRISAFDAKAATGFKSIAVDRAGTTSNDYWIEYRSAYADTNNDMKDGVVLNWGPYSINNAKPLLLDNTPSTGSLDDSTVLIGRTFSDTAAGIHITPVARGTDAGTSVRWMDVQVNRGAFTGNQKPTVSVEATNLNPAVNGSVTFTATASDPDAGDTLAYFWEWGDGTYTANNATSAAHAWTTTGTKTVRCRITDMKGQTATGQLLIQVGTSTTFFIQGTVTSTAGAAIEGAVVSAGALNDTTDSEGYYAITGLAAGSYTLAATKAGLTINPSGFTNPVVVGPSKQNINFTAPPGAPTFGTMKAGLLDQGSNTGAIILPVSDPDTAVTALTLTAVSSNVAIIPDASITFGTKGTTVRTVTASAAAGVSGVVNITITATDPQGSAANYVWPVTVNARPVLTTPTQNATENVTLDIDLRTLAADDLTPDDALHFQIERVRGGTATLLADGHTARFVPAPNYHGAASFFLTTRDQSLSSRTQFIYDFEPPDTTADGKITDQSNYGRNSTFETAGTGGEYSYTPDVPPALASFSAQSVHLTETGTGGARIRKTFQATDLNWNDEDWTFSVWVKRASRDSVDTILHLGDGDGFGTQAELHLHFNANDDVIRFAKYGAAGLIEELLGPALAVGTWHQISVIYDRTATNTGTLGLFVDGWLYDAASVAMDVTQATPLYIGGNADNAASLDRWFDGSLDDVALHAGYGGAAEMWGYAQRGVRHEQGLAATATVNITITGANQPPAISPVADVGLFVGQVSPAIPFVLSDAENEARTVTISGASSNTALVPNANIVISAVPAAWSVGDVGSVGATGSTIQDHGTFIVGGSGSDTEGTTDEIHFVRQDLTGDGEIIARVVSMDFTDDEAQAGVMMRESTANNAAHAFVCVTPGEGVKFITRASTAATAAEIASVNAVGAPVWLRLARAGTSYTAFYAADNAGTPGAWQQLGTAQTVTMTAAPNRIGLAVCSYADGTLCNTVFDKISGTPKLGGERTVTVTPAVGQQGTATITLTAGDGVATSQEQFTVTVSPNTPPTMDPVADVNGTDGVSVPSFTINVGDVHTPDALIVTATSSNTLLLPNNRVTITGTGATRTITLAPIPSETGTATITLTVSDGALTSQRTFTFTIGSGDPSYFIRAGANWRYLDTGANPAGWQAPGFVDSAWLVGPAQLGFGEGDEATPVNPTPSRIVTYFRHGFTVADPSQWAHLKVRILRDDGAVLYLNGIEIYRSNVAPGVITGSTQAASSAIEGLFEEVFIVNPPLVAGINVFATSIHQSGTTSSDLSYDIEVRGFGPSANPVIATGADWRYLDNGTDPGATWMTAAFAETAAWKTGPAQLGYGDGDEATIVASGPAGAFHITTYFRKKFHVANPAHFDQAAIRLLRDDGAVVYLNGVELFRDNLPAAPAIISTTTPADTSIGNAAESTRVIHRFDPALLLPGENTIAIEIHQNSATSSDVSFELELNTYAPNSIPQPGVRLTFASTIITWPAWAVGWQLSNSTDLATWAPVAGTPVLNGSGDFELTIPLSGARRYFRLESQ